MDSVRGSRDHRINALFGRAGKHPVRISGWEFLTVDNIRIRGYFTFMKKETRIFKALADETRLRILALLLEGELCVCELIAALELPQSTTSRHLAYLRNSGGSKTAARESGCTTASTRTTML